MHLTLYVVIFVKGVCRYVAVQECVVVGEDLSTCANRCTLCTYTYCPHKMHISVSTHESATDKNNLRKDLHGFYKLRHMFTSRRQISLRNSNNS